MTLTEQLKKLADGSAARHPGVAQDIMAAAIDELKASGMISKALKTGDTIPAITLPNATGNIISIQEKLQEGAVVLAFYRGGWCPYCNLELKALQEALPKIKAKGSTLIAITPEAPDSSLSTKEKNTLDFEILTDTNNDIARKMNLVFTLPEELQQLYKKFGIDLDSNQNNTAQELPIAATYVVQKDGTISYHFLQEDYKLRADPSDVVASLQ